MSDKFHQHFISAATGVAVTISTSAMIMGFNLISSGDHTGWVAIGAGALVNSMIPVIGKNIYDLNFKPDTALGAALTALAIIAIPENPDIENQPNTNLHKTPTITRQSGPR